MLGRSSCWRVVTVALLALLPCLTQAFDVKLDSSKVSDQLKLTLSPPQPNVSLLKLDAVIDTTGKAIATNVVSACVFNCTVYRLLLLVHGGSSGEAMDSERGSSDP